MDGRKVRAGFHCMWVCGYVREENTTEADFDAGALTRTLCRFGQQPACVCEVSIQGKS